MRYPFWQMRTTLDDLLEWREQEVLMEIARWSMAVGLVSLLGMQRSAPPELDARQILARTARVYAECETYRDSGVVRTLFIQDRGNRTVTKPFTIAFVRPDRFRYEFMARRGEEEFDRYLIWRSSHDVRTWWDVQPGVEEQPSLDRALSAARGVSGASSYTIPDLLMDLTAGFPPVTNLPNAERKADEDLDGSRCFVIHGGTLEEPMTVWIEQRTFLLRRIDEQVTFDDFRTEETTTYEPVLDEEIPESLLVFDPPVAGQMEKLTSRRGLHRPAPEDLDATGILERTAKVYAECKTYRDNGVVSTLFTDEGGRNRSQKVPFTTAFVRPDRLRYECMTRRGEEEFDRCLVWRKDQEARSWWDVRPGIEHEPLVSALSRASVVTFGSAQTIPDLLLPEEMPGVRVTNWPDAERMQDGEVGAWPCFVVQGRWMDESTALWIDQKTFLLRRVDSVFGSSETTTTYEPVIDEEIPESLLAFDPPVPEGR